MKLSITDFAKQLGAATRKTRDASLPFHQAYVKATPEQQSDLRHRWLTGHISGALDVDTKAVERILSQSRTERNAKHQAAYAKASSDFAYHVIRAVKGNKPATRKARIAKHTRDAAETFLAEFEGETLAKQIDAAIAVLRAMR